MSTILEKIADIENEMARTQKNKATSAHLGLLKAKLAKLRSGSVLILVFTPISTHHEIFYKLDELQTEGKSS